MLVVEVYLSYKAQKEAILAGLPAQRKQRFCSEDPDLIRKGVELGGDITESGDVHLRLSTDVVPRNVCEALAAVEESVREKEEELKKRLAEWAGKPVESRSIMGIDESMLKKYQPEAFAEYEEYQRKMKEKEQERLEEIARWCNLPVEERDKVPQPEGIRGGPYVSGMTIRAVAELDEYRRSKHRKALLSWAKRNMAGHEGRIADDSIPTGEIEDEIRDRIVSKLRKDIDLPEMDAGNVVDRYSKETWDKLQQIKSKVYDGYDIEAKAVWSSHEDSEGIRIRASHRETGVVAIVTFKMPPQESEGDMTMGE